MENKTQNQIEQEMSELNEQFSTFLQTKGIKAKFKLAFSNISESAKKQHDVDKAQFEAVKARSASDNKEFVEFLQTKGIKAKFNLVVENIKNGAKSAPHDTTAQIAKIKAQTQAAVNHANALGKSPADVTDISSSTLEAEFNSFLKSKGLDGKYTVTVTEEK